MTSTSDQLSRQYWSMTNALLKTKLAVPYVQRKGRSTATGGAIALEQRDFAEPNLSQAQSANRGQIALACAHVLLNKYTNEEEFGLMFISDEDVHVRGACVTNLQMAQGMTYQECLKQAEDATALAKNATPSLAQMLESGKLDALPNVVVAVKTPGADLRAITAQLDALYKPGGHVYDWCLIFDMPEGAAPRVAGMTVMYDSGAYDQEGVQNVAVHAERVLTAMMADPGAVAANVNLLNDAERDFVVNKLNDFVVEYPKTFLHDLIREAARKHPSRRAVGCKNHYVSYFKYNAKCNQLARHLQALGVKRGDLVGVYLNRSIDVLIAMQGINRVGAGYVPLDPIYPNDRVAIMLEDSEAVAVVTTSDMEENLRSLLPSQSTTVVALDEAQETINQQSPDDFKVEGLQGDDVMYCIFTSGSTGRPKGVQVHFEAFTNFILGLQEFCPMTPEDRAISPTTVCFDIFTLEVYLPLVTGASVTLATNDQVKDPDSLAAAIAQVDATLMNGTPSLYMGLVQAGWEGKADLTCIAIGEAVPPVLASEMVPRVKAFWNQYGPTEATVVATGHLLTDPEYIPVGKVFPNYKIYMLDRAMQPLPVGVAGDLWIGGPSVALGYKNRPELTSQRFIPNPFHEGRMYFTGDLGRWNKYGDVEFLGRSDNQVKVRGYRIELDEIEQVLGRHRSVAMAVVQPWLPEGEPISNTTLVAYVLKKTASQLSLVDMAPSEEEDGKAKDANEISAWADIYNEAYDSQNAANDDPTLNFSGYDNSYTPHVPHEPPVVREWVETTCDRINEFGAKRALELGCGQGMILFRVAPTVEHYVGVDISQSAINYITDIRTQQPEKFGKPKVTLALGGAHESGKFKGHGCDLIVCNGVAMYFPSDQYLLEVIQNALAALPPSGVFFLGDVRNNRLLRHFHASLKLFQASDNQPVRELLTSVANGIKFEKEFLADPEIFLYMQQAESDKIGHIRLDMKRGAHVSEFSMYRYDVTFYQPGSAKWAAELKSYEFTPYDPAAHTVEAIGGILDGKSPEAFAISGVPDGRIAQEGVLVDLLWGPAENLPSTCGEVRAMCEEGEKKLRALMPEDVYRAGFSRGYHTEMMWSPGDPTRFDVLFVKQANKFEYEPVAIAAARAAGIFPGQAPQPLINYTNKAAKEADAKGAGADGGDLRATVDDVRSYKTFLRQGLPEYMVPSIFIHTASFAKTNNAKVDRKKLPKPTPEDIATSAGHRGNPEDYVKPEGHVQETLAEFWGELLRLPDVSASDDFFLAGGHSLLAIQLSARIFKTFQVRLSMGQLLETSVLSDMAALIESQTAQTSDAYDVVAVPEFNMVPPKDMPFTFTDTPHVYVPLRDHVRLAARTWVPESAANPDARYPAVVEINPYRKSDGMVELDELTYPYLAGHGFACVRVDTRGTGDSEGLCDDEYTQEQTLDTVDVVEWVAKQPWCNGEVAVMGQSWSGFVGLHVAALDPPPAALKAIVVAHASDDRHADDMHYMGGALLMENLSWGAIFTHTMSQPPDPLHVGDAWLDTWKARLAELQLPYITWMQHTASDDPYWRNNSVCHNYDALRVPILAVGGIHAGSYRNSPARLAANVKSNVHVWLGPFAHNFPHLSATGPQAGFLQEVVSFLTRYMDHPLSLTRSSSVPRTTSVPEMKVAEEEEGGLGLLPMGLGAPQGQLARGHPSSSLLLHQSSYLSNTSSELNAFPPTQRYTIYATKPGVPDAAGSAAVTLPGFWLSFKNHAALAAATHRNCLYIGPDNTLVPAGAALQDGATVIPAGFRSGSDESAFAPVGLCGGRWFTFGTGNDLPVEQNPDDALSLVFDTHVGTQADTLLVGTPRVQLNLQALEGHCLEGHVVARLNAVDPTGRSFRVSLGVCNLDAELAKKLDTSATKVTAAIVPIALDAVCHVIPKGWRLRLALSREYWPIVWPSGSPGGLSPVQVAAKKTQLELHLLPVASREVQAAKEAAADSLPATVALPSPGPQVSRSEGKTARVVEQTDGEVTVRLLDDRGTKKLGGPAAGLHVSEVVSEEFKLAKNAAGGLDPSHVVDMVTKRVREHGAAMDTETRFRCEMRSDATKGEFLLTTKVVALNGGQVIAEREWEHTVARTVI